MPSRRERAPGSVLLRQECIRSARPKYHEGEDDRPDGDQGRLEYVGQDDSEETAQDDINTHNGEDDQGRLPAVEGKELLGEFPGPDGDEHQVEDHEDAEKDGCRTPGRPGIAS